MANAMHEMTKVGYDNLVKELENCTGPMRLEIATRLKEAISYGDISENSEYDAAKEAQAENEDRIKEIEEILRTAKVVDADDLESEGTVQTGVTVRVKDLVYDEEMTYQIVGNTEADPFNGKLSNVSLVGEHLIGTKQGDVVEFSVPEGTAKYEILEVL